MLVVNDRFKSWMRGRLKDWEYAERLMHGLVDEQNCVLTDVWAHAALPHSSEFDDPEAMVGLLTCRNNDNGQEFKVAIFGRWEDFSELSRSYLTAIWGMSKPSTAEDFNDLPMVYEIAFEESDSDEPIRKLRWHIEEKWDDGTVKEQPYDDVKINLINTRIESEIIRMISGADA